MIILRTLSWIVFTANLLYAIKSAIYNEGSRFALSISGAILLLAVLW